MAVEMMAGDEKDSSFHDFLGMSCGESPSGGVRLRGRDAGRADRPREGEASVSAASSAGRKLAPTGSDVNSGRKRSYSESSFMGLPKERLLPVAADSPEWPHLVKAHGKDIIEERPRKPHDDEMTLAVPAPSKQNPVSIHTAVAGRPDPVFSKWERSMHMNAANMGHHHLSRFSQGGTCIDKNSSAFKDSNASTILVSQAADEGSRTGMKGSGVLKILTSGNVNTEKNAAGVSSSSPRPRTTPQIIEPDSSGMSSRHGVSSVGRQMTIFYAGQAHVFDDVHPNKADVIMALAGSSGGSWSTNYSTKSENPPSEDKAPSRENQGAFITPPFSVDHSGRFQMHHLSPVVQLANGPQIPVSSSVAVGGTHTSAEKVGRDAGFAAVQEANADRKRNA